MSFNCGLLVGLRLKDGIERSDFAKILGVSYNHIQKIETGQREPSLDLLQKIAKYTGVPAGAFIDDEEESFLETVNGLGKTAWITDVLNNLNRERFKMKTLEKNFAESEKLRYHMLAVIELQEKYIAILRQDISPVERGKKKAALARETIRFGELRFDEVQAILNMGRRHLTHLLESEEGEYRCRLFDKAVTATTPAVAGIMLRCFDCEAKESEDCRGYGEFVYPENIFILVAVLEANGIYKREKQVAILRDSFEMDINVRQLADALSKHNHGKRAPEDIVNLKPTMREER
jgi:transcriptional regulator with XRE-family HTH domain